MSRAAALLMILAASMAPKPASSQIQLVKGLEAVLEAEKKVFAPEEPITMKVTFRNTWSGTVRAPDRIQPPQIHSWTLNVEEVATRRKMTGIHLPRRGAALNVGEIKPTPLKAGEAQSAAITFHMFGFVEGALSNAAAGNAFWEQVVKGRGTPRGDEIVRAAGGRGRTVPAEFQLPPGTYSVSVTVQFPAFPDRPNLPADIQAEIARLERDSVPMWNGGTLLTNSVEIRIASSRR